MEHRLARSSSPTTRFLHELTLWCHGVSSGACGLKPTVTLEKGKETKGTYRIDSPDPNAPITGVYVSRSALEGGAGPDRISLTVQEA
jgi:hypothetical protein